MYKVLLGEDDNRIRTMIQNFFKVKGYKFEIDYALDGEQGIKEAHENTYDLLLLDIMMPGLDGFEVCREVRRYSDIPIIFITGHGDVENSVDAFRNGAVHFLTKPFNDDQLLAAIDEALGIGDDGCGEPDQTLTAIAELKAAKVGTGRTATVTREMIGAAHDVMLAKGDFVLSANLLERIYLAMERAAPPPQTPFDTCPTCEALARTVMMDQTGAA